MEAVLDRNVTLKQNDTGLYDLRIADGDNVVLSVTNISFQRAVVLMEDHMYTRRSDHE